MKPVLKVVSREVGDLQPYEQNSRTHSEDQVAQIIASIEEWGFTNPILIDEQNKIIAGHGRLLAVRQMGWPDIDCIVLKGLTESQRRAYVIADNKLALNSGWNYEMLQSEIAALTADDFKVTLTGFNSGELTSLFLEVEKGPTDAEKEWEGMPEYDQGDQESWKKINVHFECQSDMEEFARLIGQTLTGKTKSIWHPRKANADLKSSSYEDEPK